jgi:transcriptional regulator with XRE-family HTH domain
MLQTCNMQKQVLHFRERLIDMPGTPSPTARGRRLRNELRRLREEAGLTHTEVAQRLEWSASKLSRIETGQSRVQTGDVRDLLEVYGVSDEATRDALVQLAREARRRGWWTRYTDVLGSGTYVGLEAEASVIHTYESQFVPGLLQTQDYARAVIRAGQTRPDPEALERRVTARMARQEILARSDPPEIWAILDEPVVSRPVGGPEVMREQLRHIIELSTRPNTTLTIQVLPLSAGAHPGMNGPFVILEFQGPKDPPMVYLETATDGLYLEEPADVERYTLRFNHLVARALGPDESRTMIADLAGRMA